MSTRSHTSTSSTRRWTRRLVLGAMHGLGIVLLAAVFCMAFLNERALQLLPEVWADSSLGDDVLMSGLIILGLAACVWALGAIVIALAKLRLKEGKKDAKPALKLSRGTIITETLVVMPVMLLLIFGLAQMAINSMAGLLSAVAAYESARTVAVWGPEVDHNRTGEGTVTHAIVEDRARIAAAGILTPVVPTLASGLCNPSQAMQRVQVGMMGALGVPSGNPAPQTAIGSMAEAIDGRMRFTDRGISKYLLAYCSTRVTYTRTINNDPTLNDRNVFTTTVRYEQPIVMPLVGPVFNNTADRFGAWPSRHVSVFTKSYELTQQLPPNPIRPVSNAIRRAIQQLPRPF